MLFNTAVTLLRWFGVVVFAASGALVASRKRMDIVGFALLGGVTGVGGGTLRDVLLGELPVFWMREPAYLAACVAVSAVVFFTAHIPQSRYRLLLWFHALGLSLFAVTGAERALLAGSGPAIAVAMGVVTATFGGVVRDVLGAESPVVLSREVYVTAALLGAMAFVGGSLLLPREVAVGAGLAAGFVLRGSGHPSGVVAPALQGAPRTWRERMRATKLVRQGGFSAPRRRAAHPMAERRRSGRAPDKRGAGMGHHDIWRPSRTAS